MSPVFLVPIVLIYFLAITFVPIAVGSEIDDRAGTRGFLYLGWFVAIILWGVTIGLAMSA